MELFRKYGDRYGFDSLMLTAQGYQESQLDQQRRSHAGAVGVMQVLPTTGQDMQVGDVNKLDPNIHAGVKYLRFMVDRYFKDAPMTPENKLLFAFASYNAGPAKIARLRKEATQAGLDENVWFNNVERIAAKRIGRETVQYVSNIFKYYVAYRLARGRAAGARARQGAAAHRLVARPGYNPRVMAHDLVVRGGTVVTDTETFRCDVGVDGGRITALGAELPPGRRELDARGLYVLPGGIDSHVHIEQLSSAGVVCADDFHSGTVAAAFGGTTTVVPFAAQHRGMKLRAVVEDYHRRATEKAVIDYAFHLILADPTEEALREDLPQLVAEGITSFKVYMTYDRLRVGRRAAPRRSGRGPAARRPHHDPCREPRHDRLAVAPAPRRRGDRARATTPSRTRAWRKARRSSAQSRSPSWSTCRS